jgi:uncharacterized phage protein gp47/JayE
MSSPIVPFRTQPQLSTIYSNALLALKNNLNVKTPGDWYFKSNAIGSVSSGLSQDIFILQQQNFPQTASGSPLDSMLSNLNLAPRFGNLPAQGQAVLGASIVSDVTIAQGQVFTNSLTGLKYICTQTTPITVAAYASTQIPLACTQVGSGFSMAPLTSLTPVAPITGVASVMITSMSDGVTRESDEQVAARIIFAFQNPPGGGSISDFVGWAMETAGVTNAFVFVLTSGGLNVINDVIFAGGFDPTTILDTPAIPYSRTANDALVTQANNYIQSVRPINNTVNTITTKTYMIPLVVSIVVTLVQGLTLSTILPSVNLTVSNIIKREIRRSIISIPPGGVKVGGVYQVPISLMEQVIDEGLSSSPYETGKHASILVDRKITYNGTYTPVILPSGNSILDGATGDALIIYDIDYSNITVTLA